MLLQFHFRPFYLRIKDQAFGSVREPNLIALPVAFVFGQNPDKLQFRSSQIGSAGLNADGSGKLEFHFLYSVSFKYCLASSNENQSVSIRPLMIAVSVAASTA